MSDWQYVLDLTDVWDNKKFSHQVLSAIIAERLVALKMPEDDEIFDQRYEIAAEFEMLTTDSILDIEDFNYVMDMLYDWGDESLDSIFGGKKVCWIKTIF